MATTTAPTVKLTRTVNLSKRLKRTHNPRRIGNSIRLMREEVARHTKTSAESVKIGGELNRYLMLGAMQGFYGIKIAIEKTGESVKVDLAEKRKVPVTAAQKADAKAKEEKPKAAEKKDAPEKPAKPDAAKKQEKKEAAPKAKEAGQPETAGKV